MLRLVLKCAWRLKWESLSLVRWIWYASLRGAFFRSVGRGTRFFGRVRFGSVEGNISIGRNCLIGHEVFFSATRGVFINIGNDCGLNTGCHVVASYGITIGSKTHVGEYCSIRDQNHTFSSVHTPIMDQGFSGAPITIGADVWLGRGVFVGAGVDIGDGAVIGANSVVTRDIPCFAVAVGAPARVIGRRDRRSLAHEDRRAM